MPVSWHSCCEVCLADLFDWTDVVAYQVRFPEGKRTIQRVDLDGREPWCGVRCVCRPCLTRLNMIMSPLPLD